MEKGDKRKFWWSELHKPCCIVIPASSVIPAQAGIQSVDMREQAEDSEKGNVRSEKPKRRKREEKRRRFFPSVLLAFHFYLFTSHAFMIVRIAPRANAFHRVAWKMAWREARLRCVDGMAKARRCSGFPPARE